jgi:lysophosphatidate acyltransferase
MSIRIFPRQASIMAKKELQWTPLLGQYMTFSGAVFVDRGNNARAVSSLRAAAERMRRESMALWMFPEGTRSMREQADMLPFKKGAFHLAIQGGLPVVPVVCENYWRLYHKGVFNSGVLRIRGEPFLLPSHTSHLRLVVSPQAHTYGRPDHGRRRCTCQPRSGCYARCAPRDI